MKTEKSVTLALLSAFTALILFSPAALAASSSTPLNLGTLPVYNPYVTVGSPPGNYGGVISNAGSQHYVIQGGVAASDGWIFGNTFTAGQKINFQLSADVVGLTTSGSGSLGLSTGNGKSWGNFQGVTIQITDELPAQTFPGANPSQVPFFFLGMATVTDKNHGTSTSVGIEVESEYWNPMGGPIIISSTDSPPSIFLLLVPSAATINWTGVQVDGFLGGVLGSTQVTGGYTTITNSFENLIAGTEQDSGQISFYGFTDSNGNLVPSLSASGSLSGSTTFTTAGGFDCSYETGIPGTCLLTGASSSGSFSMHLNQGGKIDGTYATTWSVPSTFTATTVSATVAQH